MLHAILVILKVLGIILVSVLGLLLTLILIVAFVPIRYRFYGAKYETTEAKMKVSWFFHLITLSVAYQKEKLVKTIRIFGIIVWGDGKKTFFKIKRWKRRPSKKKQDAIITEEQYTVTEQTASIPKEEIIPLVSDKKTEKSESVEEDSTCDKKTSKISSFYLKIKEVLRKIQYTSHHFYDNMNGMVERIERFFEVLEKESTKAALNLCKKELIRILRHIRPRRIKAEVAFGVDNPEITGKVFGLYGLLYPILGKNVKVVPYFEKEIMEGHIYFRGHITIAVFLMIAIKVYFNKNIREFIHVMRKEG